MTRILLALLLTLFISQGYAKETAQPLPANEAFALSVYLKTKHQLRLVFAIAPGYYLYKDKIKVNIDSQPALMQLPRGQIKQNGLRENNEVYTKKLVIPVQLKPEGRLLLQLTVNYQGCSAQGFCYAPKEKTMTVNVANVNPKQNWADQVVITTPAAPLAFEDNALGQLLDGKNLGYIILTCLGLGLLLAFTPCVLPMVPILSGIIIGQQKKRGTLRAFSLSLAYVLGMALAYAVAGMLVALLGSRVQTTLQQPWVIVLFSGMFVLMALSLFGFFQIQLPSRWQNRLMRLSHCQKGGHYISVFLMGAISSLIVSPCITPPLVGVLAYIAQTGNSWLGGLALLALGIGMGIPLLVIGATHGRFMPKTGPWMVTIERLTGVMMLAFAIYMLARVFHGPGILLLWALLFMGVAIFFGKLFHGLSERHIIRRGIAILVFMYGIILLAGALLGNSDPLQPWVNVKSVSSKSALPFQEIKTLAQFDAALSEAKQRQQFIMLDFYADWCAACINMNQTVFAKQTVQTALLNMMLLHIDITENNEFDQALMKRYNVIAPPTFVFLTAQGDEISHHRIVGELSANEFIKIITLIKNKEPNGAY